MPEPTEPTPLDISRHILEKVYREARETFPKECCGWLAADRDSQEPTTIRACENMQASGTHPTTPNRRAEVAYVFGGKDIMDLSKSFDTGTPAKVIYHSHANGMAYLSEVDTDVATSPWGAGPAYPVQQLVVGINSHRVVEAALFAWSPRVDGFVEVARFEGADI